LKQLSKKACLKPPKHLITELCDEPLILHQAPCDTRKHIIEQMEMLGHKPNIISEVAFGDFILGAVAAGMGITILPELMSKNIPSPTVCSAYY
jgi:DNA-binding transcriptional LysR family regulator